MARAGRGTLAVRLISLGLVGALGGCITLFPASKPVQLYRFGPSESSPAPDGSAAGQPSGARVGLVIANVSFPRESATDNILTMTGDEAAYVAGARWVGPARILFEEAARNVFLTHAKTAELVNVGDSGAAGMTLRLDVTAFEVRRFPGRTPPAVVRVSLNARLTAADGAVVGQKAFVSDAPVEDERVTLIVKGFDQATTSVLDAVGQWVEASAPRR